MSQIKTKFIAPNAVTNSVLAQMPADTIKGNNTGSTANATDLTGTQVTALLSQFSSTNQGVVAASGGGTSNFLRADGTWTTPAGTGVTAVSVASSNGFSGTSSGGSTPALTLSTSISGILKGSSGALVAATAGTDYAVPSGNITGTASNITATSNSTLTTLSALTTASSLSVNYTQLTGTVPTWNQATTGTASNITATTNSTITTLSALSLPGSQISGSISGTQISGNISGSSSNVTGTVLVANGGTGSTSSTAYALLAGGTTSTGPHQSLPTGTSGQILISGGPSALPSWGAGLTNPMTAAGQMIYGGASGTPTAVTAGTAGQALISGGTSAPTFQTLPARNYIVNSAFDYWQASGTTVAITYGTAETYCADQWLLANTIGGTGVLTATQVTGTVAGSIYGLRCATTTSGTSGVNGPQLVTLLENKNTMQLYNQTATFSCQIQAYGNTTQVSAQFLYSTTESKSAAQTTYANIGYATVNTSGFTTLTVTQALGTSMTTSGIIGVIISVTAVSSGSISASGNGFVVEQTQINLGSTAGGWQRMGSNPADELIACQRFFEKSYDPTAGVGTNTSIGQENPLAANSSNLYNQGVRFKVTKRVIPTLTAYPGNGGSSGAWYDTISAVISGNVGFAYTGTSGFSWFCNNTSLIAGHYQGEHWVADARM